MNFVNSLLNRNSNSATQGANESSDAFRQRLAASVTQKMVEAEQAAPPGEVSVCSLYLHFILSIFALIESFLRYIIHLVILLIVCLLYYIIVCFSCGKGNIGHGCFVQHSRMVALYNTLICATLGNVLVPWNPAAYAFKSTKMRLNHPDGSQYNPFFDRSSPCCCSCGCVLVGFGLPTHLLLQSHLISYGASMGQCSSFTCPLCCGEACAPSLSYKDMQTRVSTHEDSSRIDDTRAFYRQQYNCDSFDELLQRETHSQGNSGAGAVNSQPQQPHTDKSGDGRQDTRSGDPPMAVATRV